MKEAYTRVRGTSEVVEPVDESDPELVRIAAVRKAEVPINEKANLHKIVSQTRQALKQANVDSRGILIRPRGVLSLDIRVSKKMLDRAILVMNAFVVKIESEGITIVPGNTQRECENLHAYVFGQNVDFAIVERSLQKNKREDDDLYLLLSKEAGDAKESAKTAHAEVAAVHKEAGAIANRLGAASTKLSGVEQDVLLQGPRWRLLERRKKEFVESLKEFRGQKATVVTCGQDDTERFSLEQSLINKLKEAHWDNPDYKTWNGCPIHLTGGNEMHFVSSSETVKQWVMPYPCMGCSTSSAERTASAGKALCDALNKLKIRTIAWMQAPIQEAFREQQLNRARMFFANGATGSPAEQALEEPERIFVLIGAG